jgi:hypothetical protein
MTKQRTPVTIHRTPARDAWARAWHEQIEEETAVAESMFLPAPNHLTLDKPTRAFFVSVITEEVGKLARATNKLSITPLGSREAMPWHRDGERRLRTIASLVRRMAELWPELPDERTGGPPR